MTAIICVIAFDPRRSRRNDEYKTQGSFASLRMTASFCARIIVVAIASASRLAGGGAGRRDVLAADGFRCEARNGGNGCGIVDGPAPCSGEIEERGGGVHGECARSKSRFLRIRSALRRIECCGMTITFGSAG